MDPKRKRLYIILIICCLVLSVGIILWGRSTPTLPPEPAPSSSTQPSSNLPATATHSLDQTYPVPAVFPANNQFDTQVLNASGFKALQPYQASSIVPGTLGRDDPFKSY